MMSVGPTSVFGSISVWHLLQNAACADQPIIFFYFQRLVAQKRSENVAKN